MSAPTPAEAQALLTALTRALAGVAALALVFTAVNVTLFATSRGVPWPIALLLDPMVALALAAVLYADARLAAWNLRPPAWSSALRWFTGTAATLMNTWESIWPTAPIGSPTGPFGWPTAPDPAGIVLHGVPTLLLVLLTETTAAYRRTVAPLLAQTDSTDLRTSSAPHETEPDRPDRSGELPSAVHPLPGPPLLGMPPHPARSGTPSEPCAPEPGRGASGPPTGPDPHDDNRPADRDRPIGDGPTDTDLWERARALDTAARATTGRPVSAWRLRTDLHIGPTRAEQIRAQLLTDRPTDPSPATDPPPLS
ncbi:extensin [Streptomyces sp. NBC_00237]|uniref:extensin n=1 Tax=Streptomyces sp. NBC_00237 TaxID=2975687 RepID=UPI0022543D51|nr:extensin [Streptomyces sp. NBC_00237]MCX5206913.1 extensin [Streptomyces sp. NBC_00237]